MSHRSTPASCNDISPRQSLLSYSVTHLSFTRQSVAPFKARESEREGDRQREGEREKEGARERKRGRETMRALPTYPEQSITTRPTDYGPFLLIDTTPTMQLQLKTSRVRSYNMTPSAVTPHHFGFSRFLESSSERGKERKREREREEGR
eukprot:sb/3473591/